MELGAVESWSSVYFQRLEIGNSGPLGLVAELRFVNPAKVTVSYAPHRSLASLA